MTTLSCIKLTQFQFLKLPQFCKYFLVVVECCPLKDGDEEPEGRVLAVEWHKVLRILTVIDFSNLGEREGERERGRERGKEEGRKRGGEEKLSTISQ